jgi:hypothetical protein
MILAFVREGDGVVQLPADSVVQAETRIKSGFQGLPVGLEQVPQLEIKLRKNQAVFDEIILPLLLSQHVFVALIGDFIPTVISGGLRVRRQPYDVIDSGECHFLGIVNTKIEYDIASDDDTSLVVDELAHYAASMVTGYDLLQELRTGGYTSRVIGDSFYEVHPSDDITIYTAPVITKGYRYFAQHYLTSLQDLLLAIQRVIRAKALALLPTGTGTLTGVTYPLPTLLCETSVYQRTIPSEIYVQTDYNHTEQIKQMWGLCEWVQSSRSLRDALKEIAESWIYRLLLRTQAMYFAPPNSLAIDVTMPWRNVLPATSTPPPVGTTTSHKLFGNVIDSVSVVSDKWAGNIGEYRIEGTKRFSDFGLRLGVHNTWMRASKNYIVQESGINVARPDGDNTWDRSAQRGIYIRVGTTNIRPLRVRPLLVNSIPPVYAGDALTYDGITYSAHKHTTPSDMLYYDDMRQLIAREYLRIFGRPSNSLVTYDAQRTTVLIHTSLGAKYDGLGILQGVEYSVLSGRTKLTCFNVAADW